MVSPTVPNSSSCYTWKQVSSDLVGKTICVEATAVEIYQTVILFSTAPDTFYLQSENISFTMYDKYGKQVQFDVGDCIHFSGLVLATDIGSMRVPYITTSKVYKCDQ
jgi:hypothetical protein